jgi:uncharacterized protein YyaL (SSP411 family)
MPNRLALEQSPYLLQHAHNPVDWYPWGDEAFARARAEHKPIFLSVGYSTCHWCHVMEHESFEDAELAAQLNRDFVAIKVDREERPDVDRVYMTFVQATTGSGGWPMSVWLTPDLKPFYGGTYFPPRSKWGRPGFAEVLAELAKAWREDGERVTRSAESLAAQLASLAGTAARGPVPDPRVLDQTTREFAATFDARRGGFGQAPKFPRPSELLFLLRQFARTGERPTLSMVERTLQAMAIGGMRDQIGGGFHRYSVDADWRVPHFEKMLYDQAQLVLAYLEAYQASGSVAFADVAADTIAYVLRDLRDPGGGFYSAEDADSDAQGRLKPAPTSDEGQPVQVARERGVRLEPAPTSSVHKTEGAFYLWTHEEVDAVAGADADLVRARFGIEHGGNAPFDPHEEFGRGNIPFVAKGLDELAASFDTDVATAALRIDAARHAMFVARAARPRPHLDDKILTSWNGLMMAALARAARVLRRPDWLDAATAAASFLRAHLWNDATRTLLRRHRAGQSAIPGFVDDYANLVWGLLELFQAGGDPQWLAWAIALQRRQDELFGDTIAGGWFSTTGDDPSVLFRSKDDYDGAEPAATSVGAWNVLVLAHLTGDADWQARTEDAFVSCARRIESGGRAMPLLLCALSAWHAGVQQCAIVGADDDAGTETLWRTASAHYLPFAVFLPIDPALQAALAEVLPSAAAFRQIDSRPTAYWCRNFACDAPTTDADALDRLLG